MAFKGTPNTKGRRVGSVNKATANVRQMVQKLFEDNISTLEEDFAQMKPTERVNAMLKLMQFILPTLKAVQVKDEDSEAFKPIVINMQNWK
jgi:hypothetical protein